MGSVPSDHRECSLREVTFSHPFPGLHTGPMGHMSTCRVTHWADTTADFTRGESIQTNGTIVRQGWGEWCRRSFCADIIVTGPTYHWGLTAQDRHAFTEQKRGSLFWS